MSVKVSYSYLWKERELNISNRNPVGLRIWPAGDVEEGLAGGGLRAVVDVVEVIVLDEEGNSMRFYSVRARDLCARGFAGLFTFVHSGTASCDIATS